MSKLMVNNQVMRVSITWLLLALVQQRRLPESCLQLSFQLPWLWLFSLCGALWS
ncbi:MAG: hypothetical protein RLZZ237_1732 [Pseudomonadota bacterium]